MDKITEQDLANRGVKGLPDVPGLTTEEMQRKLEEIAREILIPKVNELVEGLNNANSNLKDLLVVEETTVTSNIGGGVQIPAKPGYVCLGVSTTTVTSILIPFNYNTWALLMGTDGVIRPNDTVGCIIIYYKNI